MATVSSHILDSIAGVSAVGIKVDLVRLDASAGKTQVFSVDADGEGRIAVNVDIDPAHVSAEYELVFHTRNYFLDHPDHTTAASKDDNQIMDVVVIRMKMPEPDKRYHIPLMLSPHSYSIWWSR